MVAFCAMLLAAYPFDVRTADVRANLAAAERGLRAAAAAGARLVALPEMWPTSFPGASEGGEALLAESDRALERVAALTRELRVMVAGSAFGAPRSAGALPTNRFHLYEQGALVARHDKVHLFTPTAEEESFSAGDEPPPVAETSIGRVGGLVCYDLRFPELVRTAFHAGVQVLAVPAQWPAPRATQWEALTVGRAVETQCFVVACNRSGSARIGRRAQELAFPGNARIVAPDGRVLATGSGGEELVLAEVDLDEARTLRIRVPVAKDERPELYRRWAARRAERGER
jgi:predicted amidohydrolase